MRKLLILPLLALAGCGLRPPDPDSIVYEVVIPQQGDSLVICSWTGVQQGRWSVFVVDAATNDDVPLYDRATVVRQRLVRYKACKEAAR